MAAAVDQEGAVPARPKQLMFSLPTSPDIKIHIQISTFAHCTLVIVQGGQGVTSSNAGESRLGSLVYAIPDRLNPNGLPITTALYSRANSMDFMTRLARILAKRLGKPVYSGGDIRFALQEDESLALRGCVTIAMSALSA